MPSVAECAEGKNFAKEQIVMMLLIIGCSLSKKYRTVGLLSLSFLFGYIVHSFLSFQEKKGDYVKMYNEVKVMLEQEVKKNTASVEIGYIQSIAGKVDHVEFDYHVRHLANMEEKKFLQYKEDIRKEYENTFFQKQEVEKFLSYVEYVREPKNEELYASKLQNIRELYARAKDKRTKDSFLKDFLKHEKEKEQGYRSIEDDMAELMYAYDKGIYELQKVNHDKKTETYENLFTFTKGLLWKVIPIKSGKDLLNDWLNKEKMMNVMYKRVRDISNDSTLEEGLRSLNLLHYVDDIDGLAKVCKKPFVKIHTDKNDHERAREIFEKTYMVYRAVKSIITVYEVYYIGSIFCDLREFLGYGLYEITDEGVAQHILSIEETRSVFLEFRLKECDEYKELINATRDKILESFRRLIEVENELLDDNKNEDLKNEKQKIEEEQETLLKGLISGLEKLEKCYGPIKESFDIEITKRKVQMNTPFERYTNTKYIENLERKLEACKKEEQDVKDSIFKLKATTSRMLFKEVKKRKWEILCYAVVSIASILFHVPYLALPFLAVPIFGTTTSSIGSYKKNMEKLLRNETRHDYVGEYKKLHDELTHKSVVLDEIKKFFGKERNKNELKKEEEKLRSRFKIQSEMQVNSKKDLNDEKERRKAQREEIEFSKADLAQLKHETAMERAEKERAKAGSEALMLLYEKAYELGICINEVRRNQGVKEYLKHKCILLVLNLEFEKKCKEIYKNYKELEGELAERRAINEEGMSKLEELVNEFNRLNKNFIKRKKEENEFVEGNSQFENEAFNKLEANIVEETKQVRIAAEQERQILLKEKSIVEEIIKQLQMQTSPSAFSSVNREPVAGSSRQK
ncbi:Hypothetical protein CINCED_3A006138 [Cinara cedri]|uniref:Uncharacterized protein n=1 Tax=Cinara cedri TaxID=506608 RepID=A0A5E4MAY1_9HEMI|nr:Hypothetical protein CINCED_3A006138 [Cinara cedri]